MCIMEVFISCSWFDSDLITASMIFLSHWELGSLLSTSTISPVIMNCAGEEVLGLVLVLVHGESSLSLPTNDDKDGELISLLITESA